jgi:hypothetical protein
MNIFLGAINNSNWEKRAASMHSVWRKSSKKNGAYSRGSILSYFKLLNYVMKNGNFSKSEAIEYIKFELGI